MPFLLKNMVLKPYERQSPGNPFCPVWCPYQCNDAWKTGNCLIRMPEASAVLAGAGDYAEIAGVLPNAERQVILERCDAVKKFLAREFVSFGDFSRNELGMRCQYASHYVTGICGAPKLAGDLRIIGDPENYYLLKIHKDDAKIFKSRVEKWRGSAGGKPKCR